MAPGVYPQGYSDAVSDSIRVKFPELGFSPGAVKLYQYYGGTATTQNTVLPNELGYLAFPIPANLSMVPGELVHVLIESTAPGAINSINTNIYACLKGSYGCG